MNQCWVGRSAIVDILAGSATNDCSRQIGLVYIYGSWNRVPNADNIRVQLERMREKLCRGFLCRTFTAMAQIDESDDSLEACVDDVHMPIPPGDLPTLAWIGCTDVRSHPLMHYMTIPRDFPAFNVNEIDLRNGLEVIAATLHVQVESVACRDALRIFVAGDHSSAGKSSVCLGILGSLLEKQIFEESDVGYIKPATQSESTQLIEVWCKQRGIKCVPIGPVVYYRGFTRAFLAGETEPTETLLEWVSSAVDRLCVGRKLVIIDGVGFPAVGSICGTSNADVARACGYPREGSRRPPGVLLVGGPGVGGAVDAFNLNSTYFEHHGVQVIGAIFNKLQLEGFYSLEACREQVEAYFRQVGRPGEALGFVPSMPEIGGENAINYVGTFVAAFSTRVDVQSIIKAASSVKNETSKVAFKDPHHNQVISVLKRKGTSDTIKVTRRSRQEIERQAIQAGAAPSA